MKIRPVTKLDKKNKATLKNFDDDVMSISYGVIVIFPIYGQFGAIQNPDSRPMVCNTYIFNKSNLLVTFYLTETEDITKKSLTQLSHYCFG